MEKWQTVRAYAEQAAALCASFSSAWCDEGARMRKKAET